jgi:hypothetical protein
VNAAKRSPARVSRARTDRDGGEGLRGLVQRQRCGCAGLLDAAMLPRGCASVGRFFMENGSRRD